MLTGASSRSLSPVLGIERAAILRLMEQDRRDNVVARWTEWANQPITPHLIARLLPGYFMAHRIPEELTTLDEMEDHASELAADLHQKIWLVVSRRLAIYFNEGGRKKAVQEASPGWPLEPYRLLRESGKKIHLGVGRRRRCRSPVALVAGDARAEGGEVQGGWRRGTPQEESSGNTSPRRSWSSAI